MNDKCKICGLDGLDIKNPNSVDINNFIVTCPRCGKYLITRLAQLTTPMPQIMGKMYLLSGAIRHLYEHELPPFEICTSIFDSESDFHDKVEILAPKNIEEKNALIIKYIAQKSPYPGAEVQIVDSHDYPIAFCKNDQELFFLIDYLQKAGLVDGESGVGQFGLEWHVHLTHDGWRHLDRLNLPNMTSNQGFVAMWFDDSVNHIFRDAIEPAGKEAGYQMIRVDLQEFNDKICDHIIAEIKKSKFLVADVSGQRQGVYFEAGYALGMGIPVIWTCRSEEIDRCHFDTRQYNHIAWETTNELREKLKNRILATIGTAKS